MTTALHITYVAGILARYIMLGRSGPIAALALWVLATDMVRWHLLATWPTDPTPHALAALDVLWVSWYVAHGLAASAYGKRSTWVQVAAGVTLTATALMADRYMAVERWMGPNSLRDIWLQVAGIAWAGGAALGFARVRGGLGTGIGLLSSVLSIMQVVNMYPAYLPIITVRIFWPLATLAIVAGFFTHYRKEVAGGER